MAEIKTGLVLEGGGVRGIYTAGVLDVFLEHGIVFDGVIGVSAGAIHGCSYLSKQHGRSIRYYKRYCGDSRFMSFKSFLRTGDVIEEEFAYHTLPEVLDPYDYEAFEKCDTPFYVVVSNVETGKAEYLQITDMREQIDYLRASASLPYFSRLVSINGKKYLDGGATDSVPVEAFQKMGYERNVVVCTREADFVKGPELRALAKMKYHNYPRFRDALRYRHYAYNDAKDRIIEMEKEGSVFIIRPEGPLDIGRLEKNPDEIKRVYDIGRADALKKLEALKSWLAK